LKDQMHIAEVDLNYAQYYPLMEAYISLYPQKEEEDGDDVKVAGTRPKPPMWVEVEKCMEGGTLDQLRNRASNAPISRPRRLEIRPAKPKPQASALKTFGMNRRERRSQRGAKEPSRTKNKSIGFERNQAFGASEGAKSNERQEIDEGGDSEGGFFEE